MQTIKNLLTFPSGTPIDAVQVKIAKVYDRKEIPNGAYGPTSVQGAVVTDATGAKMKMKVWGHPDIAKLEGQEAVIHASKNGKGLKVLHDSYTPKSGINAGKPTTDIIIEAGKTSLFQTVAVYHQDNPAQASAVQPVARETGVSVTSHSPIHGATAGEATKLAVEILIATGEMGKASHDGTLEDAIVKLGVQIARAHLRIESGGELREAATASQIVAKVTPASVKAPNPAQENLDEDVPF